MELLNELNPEQIKAVTAGTGPVLVLAGPGSGKTRVLTHRIAYLVGHLGVRPYHIWAVTFTNKAAREMISRVEELFGQPTRGLMFGTFHSACARILRREAERLPIDSNFVIFDADDQIRLIKRVLKDLNVDDKTYRPRSVHGSISRAKNELYLPETFPVNTYRDEVISRVYQKYMEMLQASNAVDFDDLLLWTAYVLENYPDVRQRYARRFEYVLVDEFQDTNIAQYTLLKHLSSFHNNIFVVGDIDQSIYRWRGADYRNVRRFEEDFPDSQVILLEQNYRSTQMILDGAMAVINQNTNRTEKRLFTERGKGKQIRYHEAYDDHQEAQFVVESIAAKVLRKDAEPSDFAVMYRTNAQSRVLEEAFLRANLPYKLVGAQRFYGRREVKDIIAYLRLVYNPKDESSLLRIIGTPPRRIGKKTLELLRRQASKVGISPGELLLELSKGDASQYSDAFPGRTSLPLVNFGILLASWQPLRHDLTPLKLMDRIIADIHYQAYLQDGSEEGEGRWENVGELRRLAADHEENGLLGFLEAVALVSDQDTMDITANAPTLLTLHAAKGLEFPIVIIVGLDDGTLPHARSMEDDEAMAEERRLFYVGITRAKDELFLINATNRSSYGFTDYVEPSRFLSDIPDSLLVNVDGMLRERQVPKRQVDNFVQAVESQEVPVKARYSAGMRVLHHSWGEGMVLNSRIQDGDETVDVFFQNVGLKKLAASLARLELIGE